MVVGICAVKILMTFQLVQEIHLLKIVTVEYNDMKVINRTLSRLCRKRWIHIPIFIKIVIIVVSY